MKNALIRRVNIKWRAAAQKATVNTLIRNNCYLQKKSRKDICIVRRADDNSITYDIRSENVRITIKRLWNWDISTYKLCNTHRKTLNAYRRVYVI